jgi:hypothetical protein
MASPIEGSGKEDDQQGQDDAQGFHAVAPGEFCTDENLS